MRISVQRIIRQSSSIDITVFVLVFPPRDDTENYVIMPYFWIPEETSSAMPSVRACHGSLRTIRDHVPYDVWEKQGEQPEGFWCFKAGGFLVYCVKRVG